MVVYERALQSPYIPIDGSEEQPCYHPDGLQGTNRFGGSDAAPNPCFDLLTMQRWGEWPST